MNFFCQLAGNRNIQLDESIVRLLVGRVQGLDMIVLNMRIDRVGEKGVVNDGGSARGWVNESWLAFGVGKV